MLFYERYFECYNASINWWKKLFLINDNRPWMDLKCIKYKQIEQRIVFECIKKVI